MGISNLIPDPLMARHGWKDGMVTMLTMEMIPGMKVTLIGLIQAAIIIQLVNHQLMSVTMTNG